MFLEFFTMISPKRKESQTTLQLFDVSVSLQGFEPYLVSG
jgi:hypothetical protein